MKKYKIVSETSVMIQATKTWIPMVDGNRDYEEFKQWLSEGNIPDPMDVPVGNSNEQSEGALKAQIKANIERGEFAEAIAKMAKLVGIE